MKSLIYKGSFLVASILLPLQLVMLPAPGVTKKDLATRQCLIEALTHEALNQPRNGQKAVLDVIHNRVHTKGFPDSYCSVVHSKKQFSYRNALKPGVAKVSSFSREMDKQAVKRIEDLVDFFMQGSYTPVLSSNVLWYTRSEVKTTWMKNMKVEVVIHSHKFLRKA